MLYFEESFPTFAKQQKKIPIFFHQKENKWHCFPRFLVSLLYSVGISGPFCVHRPRSTGCSLPTTAAFSAAVWARRTVPCFWTFTKAAQHGLAGSSRLPKAPWHQWTDASGPDANWHLNNLVSLPGFLHLNFLSLWGMRFETRVLHRASNCPVFDLYHYCNLSPWKKCHRHHDEGEDSVNE